MAVFGKEYADVYDYLYQEKDYQKECDFLEAIFSRFSPNISSVLDLGCGTGGHDLILAKRGYDTAGVDRSSEMIEIARKKAADKKLEIEFFKSNISDTALDRQFDAVISMFAVISYQTKNEELSDFCLTAKKHLKSDGIFIFDCWYGPAVLKDRPGMRIKEVRLNNSERIIRLTEPLLNTLDHTVETRFKVLRFQGDSLVSETEESHMMRFLFPQEIKYYLQVAGFKKIEFFPFLRPDEELTEDDWNMTVVATNGQKEGVRWTKIMRR